MKFLFIATMVVVYIAYLTCNSQLTRLRNLYLQQSKQLDALSANSKDNDIGRLWADIAEMQQEMDQIRSSFAKYNESLLSCEKNLHEIDELLGDIATKDDVIEQMRPISGQVDQLHSGLDHIVGDVSDRLDDIENMLNVHTDKIKKLAAKPKRSTKKPQSAKTGVKIAKKSDVDEV